LEHSRREEWALKNGAEATEILFWFVGKVRLDVDDCFWRILLKNSNFVVSLALDTFAPSSPNLPAIAQSAGIIVQPVTQTLFRQHRPKAALRSKDRTRGSSLGSGQPVIFVFKDEIDEKCRAPDQCWQALG
jgi:hypothetical protein